MPLHTGFSRSKKPKKDNRKRSSTSSTISHSVSRGSIGSVDGNKKETTSPARTNAANHDSMQKPPARLQGKSLETKKKTPDVFDFLDDGRSEGESLSDNGDHAQAAAKLNSTANASPGRHVNNARHQPDSWWYPWTSNPSNRSSVVSRGSTDSHVSPISLDTSPGTAHLQLATKKVTRRRPSTERPQASAGSRTEDPMSKSGWDLSLREAYYPSTKTAASIQRSPLPPSPPKSPEENPHRGGRRSRKNSKALQASSGYGLVASHLTSSADANHIPLYRRFENLNHRVLLHLQDEISQMEEDLHMLDEYEEAHRAAAAEHQGTKIMPASRRMDAHAQAYSSLHYRRQELLGALVQKTEQYSRSSYKTEPKTELTTQTMP